MTIFPTQTVDPAQLNYSNFFVQKLANLGVAVYFSKDDLTTVTNLLDSSDGVSTDITNNELATAFNGYRIGVDISGLTTDEQAELISNPYQLLVTDESKLQEYALKIGANGQGLNLPPLTGSVTFEFEIANPFSDITQTCSIIQNASNYSFYRLSSNGNFGRNANIQSISVDGVDITSEIPAGGNAQSSSLNAAENGSVIKITCNASTDFGFLYRRSQNDESAIGLGVKWLKVTDDNGLHYFNLNVTHWQNTFEIPSETSNLVAIGVGFSEESGSIIENGETVGYRFNGDIWATSTISALSSSTAFQIESEFSINTEGSSSERAFTVGAGSQFIYVGSYNGNWKIGSNGKTAGNGSSVAKGVSYKIRLEWDLTQFHLYVNDTLDYSVTPSDAGAFIDSLGTTLRIAANNTTGSKYKITVKYLSIDSDRYYDATTGSVDKLVEVINGEHAIISHMQAGGFHPVLDHYVFYGKADGTMDYTDVNAFVAARSGDLSRIDELRMVGTFQGLQQIQGSTGNFKIKGEVKANGGNFDQMTKFICDVGIDYSLRVLSNTANITIENIALEGQGGNERNFYVKPSNSGDYALILKGIHAKMPASNDELYGHYCRNDSGNPQALQFHDSYIDAEGKTTGAGLTTYSTGLTSLYNCIVRGGASNKMFIHAVNSIFDGGSWVGAESTGHNNLSSSATFETHGIGTQAVFTNAWSTDGTLKQEFFNTNLQGKGWNGADITPWIKTEQIVTNDIYVNTALAYVTTTGNKSVVLNMSVIGDHDVFMNKANIISSAKSSIIEIIGQNNVTTVKQPIKINSSKSSVLTVSLNEVISNKAIVSISPKPINVQASYQPQNVEVIVDKVIRKILSRSSNVETIIERVINTNKTSVKVSAESIAVVNQYQTQDINVQVLKQETNVTSKKIGVYTPEDNIVAPKIMRDNLNLDIAQEVTFNISEEII